MTTDIKELMQALKYAADKYRATYSAHKAEPKNHDALDAWDKATSHFMEIVNNDELNIIASLLDAMETETGYREVAFVACNRWHDKFRDEEIKAEALEKRNAELIEALEAKDARIAELEKCLSNLAAVSRRYLPDYDEHPEIQAADDLLEQNSLVAAGGIHIQGGE